MYITWKTKDAPTDPVTDRMVVNIRPTIKSITRGASELASCDACIPAKAADVSKIAEDTGWRASTPLEQTLTDTLNYWRARVANE